MSRIVWAGGGVLWRLSKSGKLKVAVVHRPRYDDWSLPKGKAEPGETLPVTAAREIAEETGFDIRLGRLLRTVEYRLNSGSHKYVVYWSAHKVGGNFVKNHEVDELRWLTIPKARAKVSYRADRQVLDDFAAVPATELRTMLLIRHARAGRRDDFAGPDRDRPLDTQGHAEAAALVGLLGIYGAARFHAADRLRCVQTLQPAAEADRAEITLERALTEEAYRADPDAAYRRLLDLASQPGPATAVCSQGGAIPPLLERWAAADGISLPESDNRKGSVWVLTVRGEHLVAADYLPSALVAR